MDRELLPKSIKILGKDVEIRIKKLEDSLGEFDSSKLRITVNPKQTNEEAFKTLLHECIHANLHISGVKFMLGHKLEESLVRALEHGLADIVYFRVHDEE